jgi:hypothetical protein
VGMGIVQGSGVFLSTISGEFYCLDPRAHLTPASSEWGAPLLCSCSSSVRYPSVPCGFRGKEGVNGFAPSPTPAVSGNTPVLFFSLPHPTDEHHFLVSDTRQ